MANIDIENISNSDLNGNDLFQDSESFITELDDNGESIVGGHYSDHDCTFTYCGNTIGYCGFTATCYNTIGG